ncbi:MAG: hypothetical protein ABF858_12790 [Lacticaseibacillus paracasei]
MSNETKQDVFEAVWNRLAGYQVFFNGWPREAIDEYKKRYDAALPDDLPVIPEAVSEYIQWGKSYDIQLYMMYISQLIHRPGFKKLTDDAKSWIISSSNIFARAWLLEVWRVAETGEIVKLEAEK